MANSSLVGFDTFNNQLKLYRDMANK